MKLSRLTLFSKIEWTCNKIAIISKHLSHEQPKKKMKTQKQALQIVNKFAKDGEFFQ